MHAWREIYPVRTNRGTVYLARGGRRGRARAYMYILMYYLLLSIKNESAKNARVTLATKGRYVVRAGLKILLKNA